MHDKAFLAFEVLTFPCIEHKPRKVGDRSAYKGVPVLQVTAMHEAFGTQMFTIRGTTRNIDAAIEAQLCRLYPPMPLSAAPKKLLKLAIKQLLRLTNRSFNSEPDALGVGFLTYGAYCCWLYSKVGPDMLRRNKMNTDQFLDAGVRLMQFMLGYRWQPDTVLPRVAYRYYETLVGPRMAIARLVQDPDLSRFWLRGEYWSEGRNALATVSKELPLSAATSVLERLISEFNQDVGTAVNQSYARRLHLLGEAQACC